MGFLDGLTDRAELAERTEVVGGDRIKREAFEPRHENVACRVTPLAAGKVVRDAAGRVVADYTITAETVPDPQPADGWQILIAAGPYPGKYSIAGQPIRARGTGDAHHLTIPALRTS